MGSNGMSGALVRRSCPASAEPSPGVPTVGLPYSRGASPRRAGFLDGVDAPGAGLVGGTEPELLCPVVDIGGV